MKKIVSLFVASCTMFTSLAYADAIWKNEDKIDTGSNIIKISIGVLSGVVAIIGIIILMNMRKRK